MLLRLTTESAVAVHVRHVGADLQVVGEPVTTVEPDRDAAIAVVRSHDDPAVVVVGAAQEERGAVVTAGDGQGVVGLEALLSNISPA